MEKKPSFAPNGKLILFGAESQGRGILATVSSDGKVKQKMVAQYGDIREPTWDLSRNNEFHEGNVMKKLILSVVFG